MINVICFTLMCSVTLSEAQDTNAGFNQMRSRSVSRAVPFKSQQLSPTQTKNTTETNDNGQTTNTSNLDNQSLTSCNTEAK